MKLNQKIGLFVSLLKYNEYLHLGERCGIGGAEYWEGDGRFEDSEGLDEGVRER